MPFKHIITLSILALCLSLQSCLSDVCNETRAFTRYDPVYLSASEFRFDNIQTYSKENLKDPGKLYYYKDYLFINEKAKGIHIYDNHNPENPEYLIFYKIVGNFDITIKDDILIADNVIDLISVDISNITSPKVINRVENYKDEYINESESNQRFYAYNVANPVSFNLNCSDQNFGEISFWDRDVFFYSESNVDNNSAIINKNNSASTGIGGSTARLTIVNDNLYAVDNHRLITFDLSAGILNNKNINQLGWGIETLYPLKDKLFIGSTSGMYIFSLENPSSPSQLSVFEHAQACDPVVANEKYAYVTLRDGRSCESFTNQLDIINIENINQPKLVKSYKMKNPHGLTLNGELLYISEGDYGLQVMNIKDPLKSKRIKLVENIKSTDVIYLGNNRLLSIGSDGFRQYDVSDEKNFKLISEILVP